MCGLRNVCSSVRIKLNLVQRIIDQSIYSSPFSAAQTQPELITMVKSGKIPSLPARYSPALRSAIKAMLTLNVRRPFVLNCRNI